MDTRETTRYLTRLYDDGDTFEVAYIRPGGGRVARVVRTFAPDTIEGILDEMGRGEEAGFNVYTSALPTHRQAARAFDRIWLDQDDPTAPWPFGADAEWKLPGWPQPNTLVKTSDADVGFRYQAIWKLKEELDGDQARATMKKLAAQAGADGSVVDARRVLRVPGILNAKRGSMARLIDSHPEAISLDAFSLPTETALDKILQTEVNNPKAVLGEWLAGTPEGDRSRKAYVAARFLRSCDVTYQDAGAILSLGASRCNPTMEERELEHALNSAYH